MKIVYCILDCSQPGGTERTLSVQANYFAGHGHEVHIVTTETPANAVPAYVFSDKIRFHNLAIGYRDVDGGLSPSKLLGRMRRGRTHRARLTALLMELRADVVVTMFGHEMSFLYKIKDGSKKISEFHFSRDYRDIESRSQGYSWAKRQFTLLKEWRKRRFIRHYDAFVILTRQDAAKWGALPNLHVIPNARTFTTDNPAQLENKEVLAVGRYAYQKGFDLLLQAWAAVCREVSGWTLRIVGDGELRGEMERQVARLGLEDSVRLARPTSDIVPIYRQASVFVLSSRYEGFGLVLLEAMTCGLPCVSFDCEYGPSEILADGRDGFLVPAGDTDALAARLLTLMRDPALRQRMGAAAYADSARFSTEAVMGQWERLFRSLLSKQS